MKRLRALAPSYRLVRFDGRDWRIPDDTKIVGVLDLDPLHSLVLLRRRLRSPRPQTWNDALNIRLFRYRAPVWGECSPSITVPLSLAAALAALIQQGVAEAAE